MITDHHDKDTLQVVCCQNPDHHGDNNDVLLRGKTTFAICPLPKTTSSSIPPAWIDHHQKLTSQFPMMSVTRLANISISTQYLHWHSASALIVMWIAWLLVAVTCSSWTGCPATPVPNLAQDLKKVSINIHLKTKSVKIWWGSNWRLCNDNEYFQQF